MQRLGLIAGPIPKDYDAVLRAVQDQVEAHKGEIRIKDLGLAALAGHGFDMGTSSEKAGNELWSVENCPSPSAEHPMVLTLPQANEVISGLLVRPVVSELNMRLTALTGREPAAFNTQRLLGLAAPLRDVLIELTPQA
jgi:hypothetical protein